MSTYARLLAGLEIFAKYREPTVDAQHDVLYAGAAEDVSWEDKERLDKELGWDWDTEVESWCFFT